MIERLDHLVLTVADIARTVDFYQRVLGMRHQVFGQGRSALVFGQQKFNLHQHGNEFEPKAKPRQRKSGRQEPQLALSNPLPTLRNLT